MDEKKTTPQLIEDLLDSADQVDRVEVPPFFKHKVLQRLEQETHPDEAPPIPYGWFTPKIQMATLGLFVLMNVGGLWIYSKANEADELQSFAENFGLSTSEDSILN